MIDANGITELGDIIAPLSFPFSDISEQLGIVESVKAEELVDEVKLSDRQVLKVV